MSKSILSVGKYLLIGALFICGIAMAKEYFLVTFNMSLQADREAEFSSAQNFFSQAQITLNKSGLWRSGDTFIVKYNGNAIAKFKLSTRGMTCAFGKCSWVTSVPFEDDPEIIQGAISSTGKTPVVISVQGGAGVPTTPYLPHGAFYYTVIYFWSVIVGGPPSSGLGGGGGGSGGGPIHIPE